MPLGHKTVVSVTVLAGALTIGIALFRTTAPTAASGTADLGPIDEEVTSREAIRPVPRASSLNPKEVLLGHKLFIDVRLSADNTVSCATCHNLELGGVDQQRRSRGINGAMGDINTPTVFNSSLNFKQFWDGRADSLESQVDGPTHHPKEMGSSWPQIVEKLSQDAGYVAEFAALYEDGIQPANIRRAIAMFERSLVTPNSRFDRHLKGDTRALSEAEREGYRLFNDLGCISCHQGANVGGNMFQHFGVMADYFENRGGETVADRGRFNVTGLESDRHRFKVPSLRNVELTPPYFHDGSATTLQEAVRVMARYQLGQPVTEQQIELVVAFLKTLTGKWEPVTP
jgi:cytochrome c peroxidase